MLPALGGADEPFRMRLPLRRLIALGSTVAVVACAGGQALGAGSPPPGMPPTGHIRLGVGAKKPGTFDTLTHHHHDVWLLGSSTPGETSSSGTYCTGGYDASRSVSARRDSATT